MEGNRIFANVVQASRKRPTEGCDFQGKFFGSSLSLKVLDYDVRSRSGLKLAPGADMVILVEDVRRDVLGPIRTRSEVSRRIGPAS